MKVLIDIPEEFEVDYHTDRFRNFFERAVAAIHPHAERSSENLAEGYGCACGAVAGYHRGWCKSRGDARQLGLSS